MSKPVSEKITRDIPQAIVTYVVVLVVFAPVLHWLTVATRQSEQLFQAFAILAFASAFLIWEKRGRVGLYLRHDRVSLCLLLGSLLLAGLQTLSPGFPWVLPALAMALAALLRFTLGAEQARRLSPALVTALLGFLFFVIAMPWLDWPLRMLAGQWSASILDFLGVGTSLHLITRPEPGLILQAGGRPFLVAPECNGFGLLSSSLVLTLILSVYRRMGALDGVLALVSAVVIAFAGNLVRITVIVLLAPHVTNYDLMHEAVGLLVFYSALGLVGWLVWTWPTRADAAAANSEA